MSAAVQCDACGKYVKPGGAYRIIITDYLSTRRHCSADLCPACKDLMAAQARGLQEASE
jgi:hypothetical protein